MRGDIGKSKEAEFIDASEGGQVVDGIIEDEEDDDESITSHGTFGGKTGRRRTRIVRCGVEVARVVDGSK